MNAETPQVHRVERVDDIPVLLALLQRLKVDPILDRHVPSGHRRQQLLLCRLGFDEHDPHRQRI